MLIISLAFPQSASAIKAFAATSITGGVTGALDNIDTSQISDGDIALVVSPTDEGVYFYYANATSGATESSPAVVQPDDEAGDKRWILVKYIAFGDEGAIQTSKSDADTLSLQAYDVDGAAYSTFLTLTAGNSPTMVLSGDLEFNVEAITDYQVDSTRIDHAVKNQGSSVDAAGSNQTFVSTDGWVFKVDPNGGNINFNPSGTFDSWHQITLLNVSDGAETITFDSAGLNQAVAAGYRGIFVYDGTNWLKVYMGN